MCMSIFRQKGVTLIELVVVVVLMSIVASFAVPSFQNMTQKHRTDSAQSEVVKVLKQAKRIARTEATTATVELANFVADPSSITLTSNSGTNEVITLADKVVFETPLSITFSAIGSTTPPDGQGFFRITILHEDTPFVRHVDVYASGQTVNHLPSFQP